MCPRPACGAGKLPAAAVMVTATATTALLLGYRREALEKHGVALTAHLSVGSTHSTAKECDKASIREAMR